MKEFFELRRKSLHIIFGLVFFFLIYFDLFYLPFWVGVLILGIIFSFIFKREEKYLLGSSNSGLKGQFYKFLSSFGREEEIKSFPFRGSLAFILGSILSFILFSKLIALLAITTLTFGDSFLSLYGVYFGRIKNPLNKEKHLDATILGIVFNSIFLLKLFPSLKSLIISLIVSFVPLSAVDFFPISKIKNSFLRFIFDDNILIPLISGFSLSLMAKIVG